MTLTTVPTGAALGAEVTGIDLGGPIHSDTAEEIRMTLCRHGVLVFREQEISPEAQVALTRQLGEPEVHVLSSFSLPGIPEVFVVSNVRRNGKPVGAVNAGQYWHSDLFVMWDNRVTMHRALSNYGAEDVRHLLRTSVMGEVPVQGSARDRLATSSH